MVDGHVDGGTSGIGLRSRRMLVWAITRRAATFPACRLANHDYETKGWCDVIKRVAVAVAGLVLLAAPMRAQVRSEMELTRQQIQTDRQAIVAGGMQLTDAQAAAFWPVYREYRAALDPLGDRQMQLLTDFAEKYQAMTEADTDRMLKEMIDIQRDRLGVQQSYIGKFKKVLPTVLVGRFYQIENKLDAIIMFDLAANVPLIRR
jgi:hypothetical protein